MKCLATNKKHQRSVEERHWDEMWTCIKWYTAAWCIALLDGGFISRPKLRQAGYAIRKEMIKGENEYGTYTYARYSLDKKEEGPGATNTEANKDTRILRTSNAIVSETEDDVNA